MKRTGFAIYHLNEVDGINESYLLFVAPGEFGALRLS
jgi:hypothetical protein